MRDWMRRRGFLPADAARYVGFSKAAMSRLLAGKFQPNLNNAIKIHRLTGIPVEAWGTDEEETELVTAAPDVKRRVAR